MPLESGPSREFDLGSRSARRREWLGFVLLLAVLLPLRVWRASLPQSIWIDEIYTIQLTALPANELIEQTARDCHPPLYYLVLKAWDAAGRGLSIPEGILWSRLLNVGLWLLLAAGAWFGGRRLLGKSAGTLFAWVVAAAPQVAYVAKELRSYGLAAVSLFVCFLLLYKAWIEPPAGNSSPLRRLAPWLAYALCGLVALWSHLLSGLMLAALSLAWIIIVICRREWTSDFVRGGAIAHLLILLGFLPWAIELPSQLAYFRGEGSGWIPDPTLGLFFRVTGFWFPFGPLATPSGPLFHPWNLLGVASFAVPLAATALAATGWGRGTNGPTCAQNRALRLGLLGTGTALTYLVLSWGIHRLSIASTFFGPRYSSIAAAMWAAGLAGLSFWSVRRWRASPLWAWVLLLPCLVCAILGQYDILRSERYGRWHDVLPDWAGKNIATPAPIFLVPGVMTPYLAHLFEGYCVLPPTQLSTLKNPPHNLALLQVDSWENLFNTADKVALQLVQGNRLSESLVEVPIERRDMKHVVYWMEGFRADAAARLTNDNLMPIKPDLPDAAISTAFPEDQQISDGWQNLEIGGEIRTFRWGAQPESVLQFDSPVDPGAAVLHFLAYRKPFPKEPVPMTFRFEHEPETVTVTQFEGSFHLQIPLQFTRAHSVPRLHITHPVWTPEKFEDSEDPRPLTFLFSYAWIEHAEIPAP